VRPPATPLAYGGYPFSEQRGQTGNDGLAGTVRAIIAGGAITAAGIGGSIAAARALSGTETTAAGVAVTQEKGVGWRR
jgi:hypothetical protein